MFLWYSKFSVLKPEVAYKDICMELVIDGSRSQITVFGQIQKFLGAPAMYFWCHKIFYSSDDSGVTNKYDLSQLIRENELSQLIRVCYPKPLCWSRYCGPSNFTFVGSLSNTKISVCCQNLSQIKVSQIYVSQINDFLLWILKLRYWSDNSMYLFVTCIYLWHLGLWITESMKICWVCT